VKLRKKSGLTENGRCEDIKEMLRKEFPSIPENTNLKIYFTDTMEMKMNQQDKTSQELR